MVMKLTSPGLDLGIVVSASTQSLRFYRTYWGCTTKAAIRYPAGALCTDCGRPRAWSNSLLPSRRPKRP